MVFGSWNLYCSHLIFRKQLILRGSCAVFSVYYLPRRQSIAHRLQPRGRARNSRFMANLTIISDDRRANPPFKMNKENVKTLSYEEITVGQTARIEIRITPELIDEFTKMTGDFNPLHQDDAFAKSKGFKG